MGSTSNVSSNQLGSACFNDLKKFRHSHTSNAHLYYLCLLLKVYNKGQAELGGMQLAVVGRGELLRVTAHWSMP